MATVPAARAPPKSWWLLSGQFKCFLHPLSRNASTAQRRYCHEKPRGLDCQPHTGQSLFCSPLRNPHPQIRGTGDALQHCIGNKDSMHWSQHTRAKNKDSPFRRGLQESWLRQPISPSSGWVPYRTYGPSLPLGLLLKEVMVLLLLQLTVVSLDFPVGFFHIVIHELVHQWVKVRLVTKEVNKLGAIIKVACR